LARDGRGASRFADVITEDIPDTDDVTTIEREVAVVLKIYRRSNGRTEVELIG
jgi:hypothetical protein